MEVSLEEMRYLYIPYNLLVTLLLRFFIFSYGIEYQILKSLYIKQLTTHMKKVLTYRYIIFLCLFLVLNTIYAQKWTVYSTGSTSTTLANNRVQALAKDHDNNIWIGTYNGVSYFNGTDWKNYTTNDGLIGNNVTSVAIDTKNNKWFGTTIGVSKFDGTSWTSYKLVDDIWNYQKIRVFVDKNDSVYIGSNLGLYKIIGNELARIDDNNILLYRFTSFTSDLENNVWFTTNSQIVKFNGSKFTSYNDSCLLTLGTIFYGIVSDKDGYLFAASDRGIFKFNGKNWSKFIDDKGISVFIDSKNNIWIGGNSILYKAQGDSITKFYNYPGITAFTEDGQNNIWLGTDTGLYMYNGKTFTKYTSNSKLDTKSVVCVDKDGNKWFGSKNCLTKFDGTNWTDYKIPELNGEGISSMAFDKNDFIWFVSGYGSKLFKFDRNNNVEFIEEAESPSKLTVTNDKVGNIWYNRIDGIVKYNGKSFIEYIFPSDLDIISDIEEFISIATDNKGVVWIGNNNLASFDGNEWKKFPIANDIFLYEIKSIKADKNNNIWIGSNGVVLICGSKVQAFSLKKFNMLAQHVFSIEIDSNDVKWFGTMAGVIKFDNKDWKLIAEEDGISHGTVKSIAVDKENNKWFVTDLGISVYEDKTNTTNIPVVVKNKFISPIISGNKLSLYPISDGETIEIYNLLGNIVYNKLASSTVEYIDISSFTRGMYFIRTGMNQTFKTVKFIKE
jgi:ligand-binding sensor domain-containing protein